jgi:hypothetical protein
MKSGFLNRGRCVALFAALAALAPLEYSAGEVRVSTASCTGGSCCLEPRSVCIRNNILTPGSFYISEGTCAPLRPSTPG